MRRLWPWLAAVLLSVSIDGCGAASVRRSPASARATTASPSTTASGSKLDRDNDNDNTTDSYYDADDRFVLHHGRAMSPAELRQAARTVTRYYRALASGDGATACSLLYAAIAESLPEEHAESHISSAHTSASAHDNTCASIFTELSREHRRKLAADASTLRVSGARVESNWAWAILELAKDAPGRIRLLREGPAWKIGELMRIEMP